MHKLSENMHYLGIPEMFSPQQQYAKLQRLAMSRVREGYIEEGMQIAILESMTDRIYRIIDLSVEKRGKILKKVVSVGDLNTGLSISGIQMTKNKEPLYETVIPLLPRLQISARPTSAELIALGKPPCYLDHQMLLQVISDLTYARRIPHGFYEQRRILLPQVPQKGKNEFVQN